MSILDYPRTLADADDAYGMRYDTEHDASELVLEEARPVVDPYDEYRDDER